MLSASPALLQKSKTFRKIKKKQGNYSGLSASLLSFILQYFFPLVNQNSPIFRLFRPCPVSCGIGKALKKLLKSKPSDDDLQAAGMSGGKIRTNNDVIALALFKRAAKGEVTAIRELRDIVDSDGGESGAKLSKLYDALQQEEPID